MSPKRIEVPDFSLLDGVVDPKILNAVRVASDALTKKGIRHALIGGLAVGSYGYMRATKDVDFLVGEEGYEHHAGGLVTLPAGVPYEVNGIAVDLLSAGIIEDEVDHPIDTHGVPIVSAEALIYLKLRAHRRRDKEDVVQLLRIGLDEAPIRKYLKRVAPELVDKFDALAQAADEEE